VCLVGTNVGCVVGFEVVGDTVGDSVGDTVGDSDEKHCQKSMESTVTVWGVPPFWAVHEVQTDEIAVPSTQLSVSEHTSGFQERYKSCRFDKPVSAPFSMAVMALLYNDKYFRFDKPVKVPF